MDDSSQVKTVDRLVSVLECFTPEQPAWSLTELATRLDWPKSTLHRFLAGLEMHGILRRDPDDKRWCLGYRLFIWGSLAAESSGLRHVTRPIMHELVGLTGETALLTVYDDRQVICIDKVETSHHVRLNLEIGDRRHPHAGASSKVLMAYLPQPEIEAILREKGLPRLCANTITDAVKLQDELAGIRRCGYALSMEETDPGAWGVAAPICDWRGQVVGGIGVAAPTLRYDEAAVQLCITACRQAADRVSELLSAGRNPQHSNRFSTSQERTL